MKYRLKITLGILTLFLLTAAVNALGDESVPVNITFDENSKRIDIVTDKAVPDYTLAQRGSIQFFRGRLDKPEDFITYFHDGVRTSKSTQLAVMEKIQPKFAVWRLLYRAGNKNAPRIHDQAVSFIPLNRETKAPERRVYLRLDDLKKIEWGYDKE